MSQSLPPWQKISNDSTTTYLLGLRPDWLVAPPETSASIDRLLAGSPPANLAEQRLHLQLQRPPSQPYTGRAYYLTLGALKECWFHITNTCNLSCSHCLLEASQPLSSRTHFLWPSYVGNPSVS